MKKLIPLILSLCLFLGGCSQILPKEETSLDYASAQTEEILQTMTLDEKIAQLFIVSFPTVDAPIYTQKYNFGGYIFFGNHFKNSDPEAFKKSIEDCMENAKIPLFTAVDEEGGIVTRASRYPQFRKTPFSSPRALYNQGGFKLIAEDTAEKCEFLKDLGINLNLAPVCDISQNSEDFIYERTVGLDAEKTSEYVKTVVCEMEKLHMGSALKHFPGYGGNVDTHIGLSVDSRELEDFYDADFQPFKAGIQAGATMVMVSHNIVTCMDKDKPASLSPKLHDILREELGFRGIIITDDLSMGAINEFTDKENPAVGAIMAGNDMVCVSGDFKPMIGAVKDAVKSGKIPESRIDESVKRIIECKKKLELFK